MDFRQRYAHSPTPKVKWRFAHVLAPFPLLNCIATKVAFIDIEIVGRVCNGSLGD